MAKKHVLIGVCGGIAAYKACDLVSTLSKRNFEIKVMMTEHATQFVPPLSFEALSKNPVETDLFHDTKDPIAHISLANWADIVVLVPATANVIAKVVHGISDDLVSTTFLACTCTKLICPAMNVDMYENPVTQENIQKAKQLGYQFVEPVVGHLACDATGKGKLAPVSAMVDRIEQLTHPTFSLAGKKVLITAGPTQEPLDPVRFLSNHSSGKQGYAIAQAAKDMGAQVTLVCGPCALTDIPGVEMIHVQTAQEMFEAVKNTYEDANYIIMAAAVGDYRPEVVSNQKIKKADACMELRLIKNPDILAFVGRHKTHQILCGFAMETQDLEKNAHQKLIDKNCDLLIGNNLFVEGAGFQGDTNVVCLITKDSIDQLPKLTKSELGYKILKTMSKLEKEK
ncbi:MAG: bifunctional phosphopantothenoylcysteine decarboxylase/phosphopantothenate--cysteine ligase CoaBC [Absicoccus sp.]|uniref:Coenzyme A biosynthesis bifunctional protein CoaBC n=1 Tax=Absicoccus intestinalis TaxID=2926319 RepID=A0ABU4WP45_9FIRM|nr:MULTISPECIES: bifunctional phosphopantothenoylcysteine decarboxylase/phosphopantothenate--cysteine ligase CoaBC [unclassified Absicoccus]MDX8417280.1 bifunctional phosphopantothenoylcysteine decarboxylase/phosphopantothenate--cysteine ligase CoaBC [Absicoccus sp. CLA-KB-P134]MDY3035582.1 bifunctional phosphopantothenoylcysteine decarboxylase/phosphopantothenate--cysteine ligase CoaBC [Absicoccus sp.]